MRFSAAFNRPPPVSRQRDAAVRSEAINSSETPSARVKKEALPPLLELPLELDQRVRLLGEW